MTHKRFAARSSTSSTRRRRNSLALRIVVLTGVVALLAGCGSSSDSDGSSSSAAGRVTVAQNRILRDGVAWTPHAVQLVAFVAPPSAQAGVFAAAYQHYSPAEFSAIKAWGADSVRIQLSQPGADPQNAMRYDAAFVQTFVSAVKTARAIGLNVIVSIQDEAQSGETNTPAVLPDAATNRVWTNLAPMLNGDDGIVYEMFNEPQLAANPAGWVQWASAMNVVIQTIRATGATNALLADGLNFAERLDGVVPLTDPLNKVFYSTHPYFHSKADQGLEAWKAKFGNTAATLPVIVGEWTAATTYYCDADTPAAVLQFLQYIASINVGLVAVTYDFGLPKYGGIVSDYDGTPTTYANGRQCGDTGFGPGTLIQSWYRNGAVPGQLQ